MSATRKLLGEDVTSEIKDDLDTLASNIEFLKLCLTRGDFKKASELCKYMAKDFMPFMATQFKKLGGD